MKKYTLPIVLGAIGVALIFLGNWNNEPEYNPDMLPNGQTVQEKYGCADDEIVYFGGEPGVECVSHEEDARRLREGDR